MMKPFLNKESRTSLALVLVFVILAVGIVTAGWLYYRNYEKNFRVKVEQELSAIAELKVSEIVHWRRERLEDAAIFYKNNNFSARVRQYLKTPEDEEAQTRLQTWLSIFQAINEYNRVFLLDASGAGRMSVPSTPEPVAPHFLEDVQKILRSGQVAFLDFHRDAPNRPITLSVAVPIFDYQQDSRPLGILVLRIDPVKYLYPMINRWPTPSKTAETLIVRRDGNDALFLNELRFQKNTALNLRIPLEKTQTSAVKAVLGQEGIVEGIDYRGEPVIADMRLVPGSPWFMVTRMDTSEVYAPVRERLWLIIILIGSLLLGTGAGVGLIWRNQRTQYYRERYDAAEALRALSSRQESLLSAIPDIIMEVDNNKIYTWANQPGIEFFGEDVIGKEAAFYFEGEQKTYKTVEPLFNGSGNVIYVESWQQRRDGQKRLLAWWCRALKDAKGNVTGAISSARDITERKRADDALRENEERLRTIVEASLDAIIAVNVEGRLVLFNGAAQELFQYSEEEALNQPADILLREEICEIHQERLERFLKRGVGQCGHIGRRMEKLFRRKDGSLFEAEVSMSGGRLDELRLVVLAIHDITSRKQAGETLRRSEENFRHSLDDSPMGVRIVTIEGEIIYANRAILDIYGYDSVEELKTTPTKNRYTPQSYAEFKIRREKRKGGDDGPSEYEISIVRKNGEIRHLQVLRKNILWNGERQFQVLYNDVTERKGAEEMLKESEVRYRHLVEHAPAGIYDVDLTTGRFLSVNEVMCGYSGYTQDELLALNPMDLMTEESQKLFLKRMAGYAAGEPVPPDVEYQARNKSGREFSMSVNAKYFYQAGLPVRATVVVYDITERMRAEEELRTSHLQLRALATRLQQIREEERFMIAREIHDEMGGELTGLKMDLSWLLRKMSDADSREARVALMDKIHTSNALIDHMIHIVRRISMDLRPSVLDDLGLIAALEWQLSEFTSRTEISHEFATTIEYVNMEEDTSVAVFRIFQEALTNVARHSRATKVVVVLREGERSLFGDESLVLEIRDNGRGITEEEILNPESLGLLGMKERVLAFGGELSIRGEPGGGTALVLQIPRKQGEAS